MAGAARCDVWGMSIAVEVNGSHETVLTVLDRDRGLVLRDAVDDRFPIPVEDDARRGAVIPWLLLLRGHGGPTDLRVRHRCVQPGDDRRRHCANGDAVAGVEHRERARALGPGYRDA